MSQTHQSNTFGTSRGMARIGAAAGVVAVGVVVWAILRLATRRRGAEGSH